MSKQIKRRKFIQLALATAASATIAMQGKSKRYSTTPDGSSPHKWAMVIDMNKCLGCEDCTLACRANNDVPPEMSWNRVIEVEQLGERIIYATIPCMHCEHAPCVGVCPVGATYHRPDGIVMMDYERCIGCRYCQMACAYGARSFNWKAFTDENPTVPEYGTPDVERRPRGVVEKCSFCYQRIDRGLELGKMPGVDREATPACVNACPVGARFFGDLNDPESTVSRKLAANTAVRLREASGTEPRVYYLPAYEAKEESA
jgi:Fe-S-cluster-containing dehydrogenase component